MASPLIQMPRQKPAIKSPRRQTVKARGVDLRPRRYTLEESLYSLRIPAHERSKQHNQAIQQYLHTWPDFATNVHSEEEEFDICTRLETRVVKPNTVLFKQGDKPDGWYLILSGSCTVVVHWPDETFNDELSPEQLEVLRETFTPTSNFHVLAVKRERQEFGSTALIKRQPRNATVMTNEECWLIRIDASDYKLSVAWYAQMQLARRAEFLSQIPRLGKLQEEPECYYRLAENMLEVKLNRGDRYTASNPACNGFLAIVSGSVMVEYTVDFRSFEHPKTVTVMDGFIINFPEGLETVKMECCGDKTIVADPSIYSESECARTLVALKDTVGYEIKMSDLYYLVPLSIRSRLLSDILPKPTPKDIADKWVAQETKVLWRSFKKQCTRDARQYVKCERSAGAPLLTHKTKPPKKRIPGIRDLRSISYRVPLHNPNFIY